jgi:hypothetical protein
VAVESPVDPFNRPRHRGDFGLRVPPSQRATREFFARWRDSLDQAPAGAGDALKAAPVRLLGPLYSFPAFLQQLLERGGSLLGND